MKFAKRTNWDLELNPLARAVAEHRAAGKPLIDLTVSNPTQCGFIYDTETILGALRNAEAMKYEPNPKGLERARRAVARYYADRGDEVSIDDIFMTTGTSEGYSWVMRLLCDVGDEVLIPSPGYPLLDFLADLNDVKLVQYPLVYVDSGFASTNPETRVDSGFASTNPETRVDSGLASTNPQTRGHGWYYDFHALEQVITPRTRAVVVVHPNNPTGNYCKPGERERLNQICAERGLAVIADEVFLDFALDGVPRASFVTNGKREREPLTFTLSGISKICGLPQMKVAWIVVGGSGRVRRESADRLELIADTYLSMNAPLQHAAGALLATRGGFQEQVLRRIQANLEHLEQMGAAFGRSRRHLDLEGGWNALVMATEVSAQAASGFLGAGVMVHPGVYYGLPPEQCIVLSLLADSNDLARALSRVRLTCTERLP